MIREAIVEAAKPQILKYAEKSGEEATNALRKIVNAQMGWSEISAPPKMSSSIKTIPALIKEYDKLRKSHPKEMKALFEIVPKGVGRAEVMLSYLHDDISIGGGSQPYDVDFGKYQIEVKEVKISGGFGGNFRLGVDSRPTLQKAYNELQKLYDVARHYIPEIDTDAFAKNVAKGGMALSAIKKWDSSQAKEVKQVPLLVKKDGYVFTDEEDVVGHLKDKSIIKNIINLFAKPKSVKSFAQIEAELAEELAQHDMSYFLFGASGTNREMDLHFKKELSGAVIEAVTGGTVKVKVKL